MDGSLWRRLAGAALALSAAGWGGCLNEPLPPGASPAPPKRPAEELCTAARAGLGAAPPVPFEYVDLPGDCVLDPVGRSGICYIGGCTVPDRLELLAGEAAFSAVVGCATTRAPSGVDFSTHRVLFVRQGLRVGETMSVQPVRWAVEEGGVLTIGEQRQSFCTGGQPITGGVVSYALLVPVSTSSTATVARQVCFRRTRCDCSEEESCG